VRSHAKEHNLGDEAPFAGDEHHLELVSWSDVDVVKSPPDVDLREIPGVLDFVHDIRYEWERVNICYCPVIEISEVLNEVKVFALGHKA